MVQDEPTALADAAAARDAGADIIELRVDELFTGARDPQGNLDQREVGAILRLVTACPLPCIVTCRIPTEGGEYKGEEEARIALYERLSGAGGTGRGSPGRDIAAQHPPTYLDFEYSAYVRSSELRKRLDQAVGSPGGTRDSRPGLMLSMHDLLGRPPDLWRRLVAMEDEPAARVVKVVITARSIRDNLELFDLLIENRNGGHSGRPIIALAMGRFGLMSRVLATKFGGFLTFASLKRGKETAPGQVTVRDLVDIYRFRAIAPSTKVYGVVGWPVEHSMSPLVHNAGFEALAPDPWEIESDPAKTHAPAKADAGARAFSGVYLPLPVPPEYEHFKATLSMLIDHPRLDFGGCSVTLPHKQHLVRLARERMQAGDDAKWEIDDLSAACGAANTLVIERDGAGLPSRIRIANTDSLAAMNCLDAVLGGCEGRAGGVADKRVAILGAGGAGRAVAAGLLQAGATVVVLNRTRDNADGMVACLQDAKPAWRGRVEAAEWDAIDRKRFDAIVNCTPIGMSGGPAPNQSPVQVEKIRESSPDAVVMDTVYNPLRTPLLLQASLAGFRTIDGLEMFVRQAGEQFSLWTGKPGPLGLFRRICVEALGPTGDEQ